MTIKEAIVVLKHNKPTTDTRECGINLCDAVDVAIETLEKQTPRKPQGMDCSCWNCGERLYYANYPTYCPNCGQAVDWEVE